jgi:predicted Kef-type K+ transport protein
VDSDRGRIAIGWLIVEDLAMVLTLVLLPSAAGLLKGDAGNGADLATVAIPTALTLGKVAAFMALMLVVGRRVIPWLLHYLAHTGSRELLRLGVGDFARRRLRRGDAIRCLVRARRVFRRHGPQRIRAEPARRQ